MVYEFCFTLFGLLVFLSQSKLDSTTGNVKRSWFHTVSKQYLLIVDFFFFFIKKSERFVTYFYTQQMLRAKPSYCPRHFSKIPVLTPRASEQPSRTEYISGICFLKTLDARSPFNTGKQTEVSLLPAALQVYNGLCLCGGSRVSDVCIAIRRLERTCNCEKTLEYTVNRSAV